MARQRVLRGRHLRYATQDHVRMPAPRTASTDYMVARNRLNGMGYVFVHKASIQRPRALARWAKFTTTLPGLLHDAANGLGLALDVPELIMLSADWSEMELDARARVMRHELIHALQVDAMGSLLFSLRYALDPRWRWAIEVNAYRDEIVCLQAYGKPTKQSLRNRIRARAKHLAEGYRLNVKDVERHTTEVLTAMM